MYKKHICEIRFASTATHSQQAIPYSVKLNYNLSVMNGFGSGSRIVPFSNGDN